MTPEILTQLDNGAPTAGDDVVRGIMSMQSPSVARTTSGMDNTCMRGAVMANPTLPGCVETTHVRNRAGYGQVQRGGKLWPHHRWVWTQANGPIPEGMIVCHRCDNPPCIRLDHLFLGTHADNAADRDAKGRGSRGDQWPDRPRGDEHWTRHSPAAHGSRVARARLTEADIPVIRGRLAAGEYLRDVAATYGVTVQAVWAVGQRKTWKHVA